MLCCRPFRFFFLSYGCSSRLNKLYTIPLLFNADVDRKLANQIKHNPIWYYLHMLHVQMIVYWFDMVHFCRLRWVWIIISFSFNYTACNANSNSGNNGKLSGGRCLTIDRVLSTPLLSLILSRFLADLFRRDIHRAQIMRYNRTWNSKWLSMAEYMTCLHSRKCDVKQCDHCRRRRCSRWFAVAVRQKGYPVVAP